jgi:hypothetical protein
MSKLISIDDADLDQVSGGGPIATAVGNVAGTVIGAAGRVEDGLNNLLARPINAIGAVVGGAFGGLKAGLGILFGR